MANYVVNEKLLCSVYQHQECRILILSQGKHISPAKIFQLQMRYSKRYSRTVAQHCGRIFNFQRCFFSKTGPIREQTFGLRIRTRSLAHPPRCQVRVIQRGNGRYSISSTSQSDFGTSHISLTLECERIRTNLYEQLVPGSFSSATSSTFSLPLLSNTSPLGSRHPPSPPSLSTVNLA